MLHFCILYPALGEARLGYVDIKTSPVYFYVQRTSSFSAAGAVIPFQREMLNQGGAMNLETGTFTAPRNGTYHFAFSGIKDGPGGDMYIFLQLNGEAVALAYVGGTNGHFSYALKSTLKLKSGDEIRLYKYSGGILFDDSRQFTHFTGWMLEEELHLM